jgi:hypothetical protein
MNVRMYKIEYRARMGVGSVGCSCRGSAAFLVNITGLIALSTDQALL